MSPIVSIVGAGPGDPDLLTVRAMDRILNAEVIVYDRLVDPRILEKIPTGTPRFYVGKAAGHHPVKQEQIHELLLKFSRRYDRVVRLKGGDPFVFGRGGEEMDFLIRHGVPCEVIPGITAATGCGASLGIPLTHRGLSNGVRFVTGHRCDGALDLNWASLADPDTTLVFYMGLETAPEIRLGLISAGLSPATPAAAVENATQSNERFLLTTLDKLAEELERNHFVSPTLLIVGRVAAMPRLLARAQAEVQELEFAHA